MKTTPRLLKRSSGYTLIEASVVVVVIGLLVGGILAGRTLIRGSEIQSIITDEAKYVEAAKQFKEKYGYLPGDFPNATSTWGSNTNCPASPSAYYSVGPGSSSTKPTQVTCNGDGDSLIESDGGGVTGGTYAGNSWETFTAWQQLADAGYIEGSFTGTNGAHDLADNEPGINVPATRLPGGGFEWYVFTTSTTAPYYSSMSNWFSPSNYKEYLFIAGQKSSIGSDLLQPLLTGPEAQSLDNKIDDGLPGTGLLTSYTSAASYSSPATCSSSTSATTALYSNGSTPACMLLLQVSFQ